jgi:hypothetical protein
MDPAIPLTLVDHGRSYDLTAKFVLVTKLPFKSTGVVTTVSETLRDPFSHFVMDSRYLSLL